ncbi:hypothetical protein L1887_01644 [Cichorium endivia]|nr:hypothetical protein L1887_01644 [Cichorium endivia]
MSTASLASAVIPATATTTTEIVPSQWRRPTNKKQCRSKKPRNKNCDGYNTTTKNSQPSLPMKEFNQHFVEVSRELEAEKKRKEMIPLSSDGLQ